MTKLQQNLKSATVILAVAGSNSGPIAAQAAQVKLSGNQLLICVHRDLVIRRTVAPQYSLTLNVGTKRRRMVTKKLSAMPTHI